MDNLDIKLAHINNIKRILNINDENDHYDNAVFALLLAQIVKKWGLHFLPLRMLYDLDLILTKKVEELDIETEFEYKLGGK